MCPTDMQPYIDAHKIEMDEKDAYIYVASYMYGANVLQYTLDRLLNGNKARTKICEQPIRKTMRDEEEANRPLTQEEIIEETKKYFMQRKIDKLNFDLAQMEKAKQNSEG